MTNIVTIDLINKFLDNTPNNVLLETMNQCPFELIHNNLYPKDSIVIYTASYVITDSKKEIIDPDIRKLMTYIDFYTFSKVTVLGMKKIMQKLGYRK